MSLAAAAFVIAACTRVTDRVIEPVGGGDAATSVPESTDASLSPIGPIAHSPLREPAPDFTLVRSPELGIAELTGRAGNGLPQGGNAGTGANTGYGGSDRRPAATGGRSYF